MRGQEELNDISAQPLQVSGMAEIAHNYDGFIIDLWGVIHDGRQLFDGVVDCLTQLKTAGKTVVFLSNAPRSSGMVIDQLTEFGLPLDLYAGVVTSGDATIEYLRKSDAKTYFHIGCPIKDFSLLVGIGMNPAEQIVDADLIIASNFLNEKPNVEDYQHDFERAIAADIPMICANPDLIVHRGDQKVYCAGTLAADYENRGGKVIYFGKPHKPVYEHLMSKHKCNKWLAIGDALATDIKGANHVGLDSLFVLSGIHRNEQVFFENIEVLPKYYISHFCL